tara:strand:+ start:375 stop:611 length:237 start_codon:yes stop_codon:yes gene_type:complete
MKEKHVQGIMNKYIGMRDIALGDLSVYLENAVGVGEHSDVGAEIEKKIGEINACDGIIDTMTKYFGKDEAPEEAQPKG